jgi:hypothetical protein
LGTVQATPVATPKFKTPVGGLTGLLAALLVLTVGRLFMSLILYKILFCETHCGNFCDFGFCVVNIRLTLELLKSD